MSGGPFTFEQRAPSGYGSREIYILDVDGRPVAKMLCRPGDGGVWTTEEMVENARALLGPRADLRRSAARDRIARLALPVELTSMRDSTSDEIAIRCYGIADAMLAEGARASEPPR